MEPAQEEPSNDKELKVKEKLTYSMLIKQIVLLSKELFIISLIFYLILFVLETVFPGFVSYNFNLNWALGVVILFGLISAFAPYEGKEQDKKNRPKIFDYLMSVFFGLLGGLLIYSKIGIDPSVKLTVAVFGTLIIIAISIILLTVDEKVVKDKEAEIEQFVQKTFLSRETFIYPIAFFRLILFRKINFPMILILVALIFTILSLPGQKGYQTRKIDTSKLTALVEKEQKMPRSSNTPLFGSNESAAAIADSQEKVTPSSDLTINVMSGSKDSSSAESFARILKDLGFVKVFFGNADRTDYKNAEIIFRPEDVKQAALIKDLLEKKYSIIKGSPSSTTSAEISIILGSSRPEEDTSSSSL